MDYMPFVRIKFGPDKGKVFEVKDNPITIGRDKSQVIQLLDQGASRAHAEIFKLGELYIVKDTGSTNGTFVNNSKIAEEVLKEGDEILIGSTVIIFEEKLKELPEEPAFDEKEELPAPTLEIAVTKEKPKDPQVFLGKEVESRNLTAVLEIANIITEKKKLDDVLYAAIDLILKMIGASHAYFLTVDKLQGKLNARIKVTKIPEVSEIKLSRVIVKHVLKTKRPTLTSDATQDDRFSFSESIVLRKIKSVICVPLFAAANLEGVLYFHRSEGGSFTLEDLELATEAALQLSVAISSFHFESTLRKGMVSSVQALVQAMEIYNPKNEGHSQRVADYSQAIAMQMELPEDDVFKIRLSALLHDVGKLSVHYHSGVFAQKSETVKKLVDEKHVYAGEKIVSAIEGGQELLPGVKYHHEKADGSGFPYRLKNDETPVMARVIMVANEFDNQCSAEEEATVNIKDVLKNMADQGGKQFDDDVIKALLICHRNNTLYQVPKAFPESL